jgi:hypothetical protein
MAWETVGKVGRQIALGVRFDDPVEKRQSSEVGYAWRFMDGRRIQFHGSSDPGPPAVPSRVADALSPFPLPGTLGSFLPPSAADLPSQTLLQEMFFSLVKILRDRSRGRMKVVSADLQAGAARWFLRNSRGAHVEWGGTLFSALLTLDTPVGRLLLPLASRDIHKFRLDPDAPFLGPYVQLPLPEKPPPAGRRPAAWSSLCAAFVLARLGERILAGMGPLPLPPGFMLRDDPVHPEGLAWAPVDGEGRPTAAADVLSVQAADGAAALERELRPTGHAIRNSVFDPPSTGFHNLFLDGPPGSLPGPAPLPVLTIPLRMDWLDGDRFSLYAQGFTYSGAVPEAFHPCLCVRATVRDLLSSLHCTLPPVQFFPFGGSTGAPGLVFKGLNFFT